MKKSHKRGSVAQLLAKIKDLETGLSMLQTALAEAQRRAERAESLREENNRLHELATVDDLTLIPNRRAFNATMDEFESLYSRGATKGVLVYVDLDRFKDVNDRLGREAGDEVLQKFASLVRHKLRGTDFFARFGGDEFVILLKNTAPRRAKQILRRLGKDVRQIELTSVPEDRLAIFLRSTGREAVVQASFGMCEATKDCYRRDMLLARAEANVPKYQGRRIQYSMGPKAPFSLPHPHTYFS